MTASTPHKRERVIDFEWSIRPIFIVVALLVGAGALLISLISRLPQVPARIESTIDPTMLTVSNWLAIPAEPLYWPFHTLIELLGVATIDVRYISAGFALAAVLGTYALFQTWFNRYYAAIGSTLMVCNTLFLSLAIYATPASFVLFYVVLSILAMTLLYRGKGYGYLLGATTVSLSLYVGIVGAIGGILQLSVLTYVLMRKRLRRPSRKMAIASVAMLVVFAMPAAYLIIQGQYRFLEAPAFALTHSFEAVRLLTVGLANNSLMLPATWPLLEIGSFALLTLGVAVSINRRKADRYKLLLILFAVAFVAFLTSGQNYPLLALLLVPMAVLTTTGLRYLSDVWTSVFPRNKAAAVIAHGASILIVTFICTFHLVRFAVLLPQLPEYKQSFRQQSSVDAVQYIDER